MTEATVYRNLEFLAGNGILLVALGYLLSQLPEASLPLVLMSPAHPPGGLCTGCTDREWHKKIRYERRIFIHPI
jgi:hypothetical protein